MLTAWQPSYPERSLRTFHYKDFQVLWPSIFSDFSL